MPAKVQHILNTANPCYQYSSGIISYIDYKLLYLLKNHSNHYEYLYRPYFIKCRRYSKTDT